MNGERSVWVASFAVGAAMVVVIVVVMALAAAISPIR